MTILEMKSLKKDKPEGEQKNKNGSSGKEKLKKDNARLWQRVQRNETSHHERDLQLHQIHSLIKNHTDAVARMALDDSFVSPPKRRRLTIIGSNSRIVYTCSWQTRSAIDQNKSANSFVFVPW